MRELVRKHLRHLGIRCDGGLPDRIRRMAMQRAVAAAGLKLASCHNDLCRRKLRQAAAALYVSFAGLRTCVQGTRLATRVAVPLDVLESLWFECHEDDGLVYAELAAPVLSALDFIANSPALWPPRRTRTACKLLRANKLAQEKVHAAVAAASTALVCYRTASRYTQGAASAAERHTAALRMAMTADDYCKVAAGDREIGHALFSGGRDLLCFDPTTLVAASTRMRNTRSGPSFRCLVCDGEEDCEAAVGPCPRGMMLCRKYMHYITNEPNDTGLTQLTMYVSSLSFSYLRLAQSLDRRRMPVPVYGDRAGARKLLLLCRGRRLG